MYFKSCMPPDARTVLWQDSTIGTTFSHCPKQWILWKKHRTITLSKFLPNYSELCIIFNIIYRSRRHAIQKLKYMSGSAHRPVRPMSQIDKYITADRSFKSFIRLAFWALLCSNLLVLYARCKDGRVPSPRSLRNVEALTSFFIS